MVQKIILRIEFYQLTRISGKCLDLMGGKSLGAFEQLIDR